MFVSDYLVLAQAVGPPWASLPAIGSRESVFILAQWRPRLPQRDSCRFQDLRVVETREEELIEHLRAAREGGGGGDPEAPTGVLLRDLMLVYLCGFKPSSSVSNVVMTKPTI